MRNTTRTAIGGLVLGAVTLTLATTPAGAGNDRDGSKDKAKTVKLQILSFNDYHGHLEAPSGSPLGAPFGDTTTALGGSEYLSTKLTELRGTNEHTLTVAAGDLIGGSPVLSGLFHDEPSVESLDAMELDVIERRQPRVRRGRQRAAADAERRLPPDDGCYSRTTPTRVPTSPGWRRTSSVYLPPTDPPAHVDQDRRRCEGRVHRHDARGHSGTRRPVRHPGLRLPRRGHDRQRRSDNPPEVGCGIDRRAPPRRRRPDRHLRRVRRDLRPDRRHRLEPRPPPSISSSRVTPISPTSATSPTRPGRPAPSPRRRRSAGWSPRPG